MFKKQYKIIFFISFIFLVTFFVFFNIYKDIIPTQTISKIVNEVETQIENISITITVDNTILSLDFNEGTSLYEVLIEAKAKGKINFQGRKYSGLGFFVSDIGSLHQGAGKNLMYYINGEEATVGVSSYMPKDSDIISWELE